MKLQQFFAAIKFPTYFFTITVLVFFIGLPISDCSTQFYEACSSTWTCGAISNISYPFWGTGRPSYCGRPELELDCGNNTSTQQPILKIGSNSVPYRVVGINDSSSIVTIMLLNSSSENICNNLVFNQALKDSVDNHLLAYGAGDEMIQLFYGCQHNITHARYSVTCQSFSGNIVTGYYQSDVSEIPSSQQNCQSVVGVPVLKTELGRLKNGNETLFDVFKQGIEMEYDATNCSECKQSGGVCGWSDGHFECFCRNHSSRNVCQKSGLLRSWILGSAFSALGICILIVIVCCIRKRMSARTFAFSRKNKEESSHNVDTFLRIYGSLAPKSYSYASLRKMTNGFKDKLGEGGYAIVYKGKLSSGRRVAVKVLKQSKGNGEDFINEVASISRTNHVNIVALLGFCYEGSKRALIYEFMPNGSLEKFTYHDAEKESLPWETQFKIAIGIAKGLDYLHQGCNARILHFDIKPHNILLDEEFCPKISDFGLARLCPLQESTISILQARGTIGYIAPEVFCRNFGGVSNKSDVYSFGMMVLDMVCGRRNQLVGEQRSSQLYFPEWIYNRLEAEKETVFQGTTNDEEKALQKKMIVVGLWCIQTDPSKRPSMSKVIEMLQGSFETIEMPPSPYVFSAPPKLAFDTSSGTLAPAL